MLLISTLSSSYKALQDGCPPHVPIIRQPILDVLLLYPDPDQGLYGGAASDPPHGRHAPTNGLIIQSCKNIRIISSDPGSPVQIAQS